MTTQPLTLFSIMRDDSLARPVLIFTIPASFRSVVEGLTLNAVDAPRLLGYFIDGGVVMHPDVRGGVVVNARGLVRVVLEYVVAKTPFSGRMDAADSVPEAMARIQRWIDQE